jgi:hypothetical protein
MSDIKKCPENKILNIKTKRCVLKTGKIGKKILNKSKSPLKLSTSLKDIKCPENKILNIETKRCVLKTGKIGLKILNENKDIKLKYDNYNSCYVDSLLVAFFHFNNKNIYNKFFNKSSINSFDNKELKILGNKIQKELLNIYLIINNKGSSSSDKYCSLFRKLIDDYYNIYRTKINTTYKIFFESDDNWVNKQADIFELLNFLSIIFNFKNINDNKILDGNTLYYSNFIIDIPHTYLINKKQIDITEFIPLKIDKYSLDSENKFRNSKGELVTSYEKKYELLKSSSFIFIQIYRNNGSFGEYDKLTTIIDFPMKIKVKENKKELEIKSIIIHYGESTGHYICLIRRNNKWFEYNDMSGLNIIKSDEKIWKKYKKNIVGLLYAY